MTTPNPKKQKTHYIKAHYVCKHEDMRVTEDGKLFCQECFGEWEKPE